METKFIQNLILKSTLIELFFLIQCSSLEKTETLVYRNTNLAIYQTIDAKNNLRQRLSANLIKDIFSSFQKKKNFLGQRDLFFTTETSAEFSLIISENLKPGLKFLFIIKEDDALSPFTRFQKHSFEVIFHNGLMFIRFQELSNFYNLGYKAEFQDWAIPYKRNNQCWNEAKIFFETPAIEYLRNPNCQNKFDYSLLRIDLSKFGKNIPTLPLKKSAETRLEDLLRLYNKGYITKDDYDLKKAEVLGEL